MGGQWEGEQTLREALQQLTTQRPVPASKVKHATMVALQHLKEYKMVVYEIEKFVRKSKPHDKIAGLFVIDALCRNAQAKYGEKDVIVPRFTLKMADTLASLSDLSSTDMRQAKRVVGQWKRRNMFPDYVYPDFLDRSGDAFDPSDLPSPGQSPEDELALENLPELPVKTPSVGVPAPQRGKKSEPSEPDRKTPATSTENSAVEDNKQKDANVLAILAALKQTLTAREAVAGEAAASRSLPVSGVSNANSRDYTLTAGSERDQRPRQPEDHFPPGENDVRKRNLHDSSSPRARDRSLSPISRALKRSRSSGEYPSLNPPHPSPSVPNPYSRPFEDDQRHPRAYDDHDRQAPNMREMRDLSPVPMRHHHERWENDRSDRHESYRPPPPPPSRSPRYRDAEPNHPPNRNSPVTPPTTASVGMIGLDMQMRRMEVTSFPDVPDRDFGASNGLPSSRSRFRDSRSQSPPTVGPGHRAQPQKPDGPVNNSSKRGSQPYRSPNANSRAPSPSPTQRNAHMQERASPTYEPFGCSSSPPNRSQTPPPSDSVESSSVVPPSQPPPKKRASRWSDAPNPNPPSVPLFQASLEPPSIRTPAPPAQAPTPGPPPPRPPLLPTHPLFPPAPAPAVVQALAPIPAHSQTPNLTPNLSLPPPPLPPTLPRPKGLSIPNGSNSAPVPVLGTPIPRPPPPTQAPSPEILPLNANPNPNLNEQSRFGGFHPGLGAMRDTEQCAVMNDTTTHPSSRPLDLRVVLPFARNFNTNPPVPNLNLGGDMSGRQGRARGRKPCRYYMQGKCTYGDRCTFSHDDLSQEQFSTSSSGNPNPSPYGSNLSMYGVIPNLNPTPYSGMPAPSPDTPHPDSNMKRDASQMRTQPPTQKAEGSWVSDPLPSWREMLAVRSWSHKMLRPKRKPKDDEPNPNPNPTPMPKPAPERISNAYGCVLVPTLAGASVSLAPCSLIARLVKVKDSR